MILSRVSLAFAVVGVLPLGAAQAQYAGSAPNVLRSSFEYGSYYQEAPSPSPSDAGAEAAAPATSYVASSLNNCSTCGPACSDCSIGCCDTDCCGGCGGGCLGGLGGLCGFSINDSLLADTQFFAGGWTQWGYHNKDTSIPGLVGAFNTHPGGFNGHQNWAFFGREADGSQGFDVGFRADIMYGVDADTTQAFGNPAGTWDFANGWDYGIYGWALPQLYGEVAMGDLSVIMGHFYTLVGYEVVTAPDNFFYSHAFTMFNSEPFTHTGVLATYSGLDAVTLYGGWTLGWDTAFNQLSQGSNFLGGASVSPIDNVSITYITYAGNLGWISADGNGAGNTGYGHSVVVDVSILDDLNYVLQSDFLNVPASGVGLENYGINQYLIYSVNDYLGVGGRMEWYKTNGTSVYAATAGVNVKPCSNFIVRPEIRHNWAPGVDYDQTIFGFDTILTF